MKLRTKIRITACATLYASICALCALKPARADVVVCVDQACTQRTAKPKASLVATDVVLWCSSGSTAGSQSCATPQPLRYGSVQQYSWVLTDTGWYRLQDVPTAPVFVQVNYICRVKASFLEYRWEVLNTFDGAAVWYCDTPTEIVRHHYCGDVRRFPQAIARAGLEALGIAAQNNQTRACTATEFALVQKIDTEQAPQITVAPNGTSATRPIYAATATNRRGAEVGRISVLTNGKPTPCSRKRLQSADGTGSMYFEVQGGYTLCKIVGPISK